MNTLWDPNDQDLMDFNRASLSTIIVTNETHYGQFSDFRNSDSEVFINMGRKAFKNIGSNSTVAQNKGKNDMIPKVKTRKRSTKATEQEKLMELAKKLIISHPEFTLEQAYSIETKRQAARKKREEEPKIDASIHLRIDEEMEQYMMERNENEYDKENLIAPKEGYHAEISVKLNQMEISDEDDPREEASQTNQ
ncbi:hypothetical protein CRE_17496 [Caenorhabditis remanei]|uniref:Uncharacterized protein n=1 Tax=Caenorhabditis remanei TaxID=31234 RepID=E3N7T1_CAERE|nr:hypothetical protein CRE_17496 [Caenorhabditis remanei]